MADDRTTEFLSLVRGLPGGDSADPHRGSGLYRSPSNSLAMSGPLSTPSSTNPNAYMGGSNLYGQHQNNNSTGKENSNNNDKNKNPLYKELRQFHTTAAGISRDIASTSALLQELAQLVRRKSLFQDDAPQVNRLVGRIKSSIENLNARLDHAQHDMNAQKRKMGQNSQVSQQVTNLVEELKSEFATAATGFKKVLQQRTDHIKETDDFQKQVYSTGGGGGDDMDPIPNMSMNLTAPPPVYGDSTGGLGGGGSGGVGAFPTLDLTSGMMSAGEATGSSLPRPHGAMGPSTTGVGRTPSGIDGGGMYGETVPLTPLDIQRMEEESGVSQSMQLIPDADYLRERADAMSTVETHIVELGAVFNRLAVVVSEHRDMVQRVEDNVEDTKANVDWSMNVLTDTLSNLRSNKQLMMRILPILVTFIIAFIIFFA